MRGYLKIMIFMHFPTQYRSSGIQFRVVVISVLTVTHRALLRHHPHPGRGSSRCARPTSSAWATARSALCSGRRSINCPFGSKGSVLDGYVHPGAPGLSGARGRPRGLRRPPAPLAEDRGSLQDGVPVFIIFNDVHLYVGGVFNDVHSDVEVY